MTLHGDMEGHSLVIEQIRLDRFVCCDRYSMLAVLTTDGYISSRVIPGFFNTEEFRLYITEQVVRSWYCVGTGASCI